MWVHTISLLFLFHFALSEITVPTIDSTVNDGVTSHGINIIYGDEDLTMFNEVTAMEDEAMKKKVNLNQALPPLPAEDVKCLMSVDRYCSVEMGKVKSTLIQALKDDCKSCSNQEKDKAGKIAASMMAHDPVAWKMFLTRSALQNAPPKDPPKHKDVRFKTLGEPEAVIRSKNRYIKDGFKVRVKRYAAEIL